jgi:hypothetical protein
MNFLALGTNRKALGVTTWNPNLAAEGNNGCSHNRGLDDFFFPDVVRKSLVIARFEKLWLY